MRYIVKDMKCQHICVLLAHLEHHSCFLVKLRQMKQRQSCPYHNFLFAICSGAPLEKEKTGISHGVWNNNILHSSEPLSSLYHQTTASHTVQMVPPQMCSTSSTVHIQGVVGAMNKHCPTGLLFQGRGKGNRFAFWEWTTLCDKLAQHPISSASPLHTPQVMS